MLKLHFWSFHVVVVVLIISEKVKEIYQNSVIKNARAKPLTVLPTKFLSSFLVAAVIGMTGNLVVLKTP